MGDSPKAPGGLWSPVMSPVTPFFLRSPFLPPPKRPLPTSLSLVAKNGSPQELVIIDDPRLSETFTVPRSRGVQPDYDAGRPRHCLSNFEGLVDAFSTMAHVLPPLPWANDALAPHISKEAIEFHYGKHHTAYVNNLNKLTQGNEYEGLSVEDVIKKAPAGGVYNNAAQIWNHTFFWNSMKPNGGGAPSGPLLEAINKKYGDFDAFKAAFTKSAVTNFGSGWTWVVRTPEGEVDIVNTTNANTVVGSDNKPLLVIDVWEHAYYIDYRNRRGDFVAAYVNNLINWDFASQNFGQ